MSTVKLPLSCGACSSTIGLPLDQAWIGDVEYRVIYLVTRTVACTECLTPVMKTVHKLNKQNTVVIVDEITQSEIEE